MGHFPLRIALIYAGISILWIIGSDRAVDLLFPHAISMAQTFKGWAFIAVTTILLFGLLRAESKRRAKIESRLRESEKQFRAIAETSPVALGLVRLRDGIILFANPSAAQLCAREAGELEGLTVADLGFHPDDNPEDVRRALARRRGIQSVEGTLVLADGRHRAILGSLQKIRLRGQAIIVIAAVDLTESHRTAEALRVLEMELAHASRVSAMGEMAAQFAHELNQPLTIISSYASGALDLPSVRGGRDDDVAAIFGKIAEQAKRAGEIIRRTRKFVEKHEHEKARIDVNALVRETAQLIHGDALLHAVDMRLQLADPLPLVMADVVQLQQVIVNLARNGIEATTASASRPKRLVIRTEPTPGGVMVSVEDTGVGIPPELQPRLFEPFFTTKPDGLGIGLSVCQSIVEAHGAELTVTSAPGQGTRFQFALPALNV